MFECGIGHGHDQFVRRLSVGLNNYGTTFALGVLEERTELFEGSLLIAKINRRHRAAGDADDLLIALRAKQKRRSRRRNRDSGLQNEIRTQEREEDQEKDDINCREDNEPAEIVFLRAAQLHPESSCRSNDPDALLEKSATFPWTAGN